MLEIAEMIETVLSNVDNEQVIAEVRARVNAKMKNTRCLLINKQTELKIKN